MYSSNKVRLKALVSVLLCLYCVSFLSLNDSPPLSRSKRDVDKEVEEQVDVDVFYTSRCPDALRHFKYQFYPYWLKVKNNTNINWMLHPFGKTQWLFKFLHVYKLPEMIPLTAYSFWELSQMRVKPDGSYQFRCQFGKNDCKSNLLHACIIQESGNSSDVFIPIIHCMMATNRDQIAAAEGCVEEGDLDWWKVDECAQGIKGQELMRETGTITKNLRPELTFIPWFTLNGAHTDEIQKRAYRNFHEFMTEKIEIQGRAMPSDSARNPRICISFS